MPPAAQWLQPKLGGWANQMWMRFGGDKTGAAVYLVGSSLSKEHPRDVDVVIVLEAPSFALRYGGSVNGPRWHEGRRRMAREVAGLVPGLCAALTSRLPPDLKVISTYYQEGHYEGKPRLRLDEFGPPTQFTKVHKEPPGLVK